MSGFGESNTLNGVPVVGLRWILLTLLTVFSSLLIHTLPFANTALTGNAFSRLNLQERVNRGVSPLGSEESKVEKMTLRSSLIIRYCRWVVLRS